jgi:BirA family biotin operon repressor/biotin-[acetyl-CoA-carboxylase] ligase
VTVALLPERVAPLLRGRFGRTYRHLDRCASTQLELRPDDEEGTVALAEVQEAGRGRRGRSWQAPGGSALLLSLLLRPPGRLPPTQLPLAAGVAVARTVESVSGLTAWIKWPNDVLVDDAKVAGILAESKGGGVVLGIGLNVNQTADELPSHPSFPAASLRSIDGRIRDRAPMLAELLWQLELAYDAWITNGLGALHAELAARDWLLGRAVRVGGLAGTAVGIGNDGALLVRAGTRVHRVTSGDLTLTS